MLCTVLYDCDPAGEAYSVLRLIIYSHFFLYLKCHSKLCQFNMQTKAARCQKPTQRIAQLESYTYIQNVTDIVRTIANHVI